MLCASLSQLEVSKYHLKTRQLPLLYDFLEFSLCGIQRVREFHV